MKTIVAFVIVLLSSATIYAQGVSLPEYFAERERDQWCFLKRADQVKGQAEVKAEIERKAQKEGKTLREYSCVLRPYSDTDKRMYYKCATNISICDDNIRTSATQNELARAFMYMRDSAYANGEGYYYEAPGGRRVWCDRAYGCRPR